MMSSHEDQSRIQSLSHIPHMMMIENLRLGAVDNGHSYVATERKIELDEN